MLTGARLGRPNAFRRLVSGAMARRLKALVVPGPEVARAAGLDLAGAGIEPAAGPRQANVLLVVGPLTEALREPAATAYAQMMRPRALVCLGGGERGLLPAPDVEGPCTAAGLADAARRLRTAMARKAFAEEVAGTTGGTTGGPAGEPEAHDHTPHDHAGHSDAGHEHARHGDAGHEHAGHEHGVHGHSEDGHDGHRDRTGPASFMSMVAMTEGQPRGSDGLAMDRREVPFGPFLPGLPGGLRLCLTLAGDTVAGGRAETLPGGAPDSEVEMGAFLDAMASADPLAGESYRLLACRAIEAALERTVDQAVQRRRVVHAERSRIVSHLGWLAQLGRQVGPAWLERHATRLQQAALGTGGAASAGLDRAITRLARRLAGDRLLAVRLPGVGILAAGAGLRGPVARAAGMADDARGLEDAYCRLGFAPRTRRGGDALARLRQRLDELTQSLELLRAAGGDGSKRGPHPPPDRGTLTPGAVGSSDAGEGGATLETPRGTARLRVRVAAGRLAVTRLEAPSAGHLAAVPGLVAGLELGDALVAVGSLDLSPWESTLPGGAA